MKTLHLSLLVILLAAVAGGTAYAQYGSEASNPAHQSALQQALDLYRMQNEKQQLEKQQDEEVQTSFHLAEVGVPLATGISIGVLFFTRKRR
jgi:hypothetical protein